MNDQVEIVVERFNANQEALEATQERQRQTARRIDATRRQLASAERVMGERVRAIYIDGPVTRLGQLLEVQTVNDAVTMAHYQQSVTDADVRSIANVEQSKEKLTSLADTLASQQRQQQRIRARLALKRKLAAERAARLKAAQEAAAREAAQREAASTTPTGAADQAIAYARAQIGKPYQWGATGPDSFDCSGLTMAAYASAGVSIPRTSREQWTIGTHIDKMSDLLPGDLVFYAYGSTPDTIHHVGLFIGDGLMIEAPYTCEEVRTASINRPDYLGATRPTSSG